MSKILHFPTSPGSFMKALIIYDGVASAAKANEALQQLVQRADNSLSGSPKEMLHGATRNHEPRLLILADQSLI